MTPDDRATVPPREIDGAVSWYRRVLLAATSGPPHRSAIWACLATLEACGALAPGIHANDLVTADVDELAHRLARAWAK